MSASSGFELCCRDCQTGKEWCRLCLDCQTARDDCPHCYSTQAPQSPAVSELTLDMCSDSHVPAVPEIFQLNSARDVSARATRRPEPNRFRRAITRGEKEFARRLAVLQTHRLDGRSCGCGECVSSVFCNHSWYSARTTKKGLKLHRYGLSDVVAKVLLNQHRRKVAQNMRCIDWVSRVTLRRCIESARVWSVA